MSSYDIRVKWFGLLHHQHQERYQVLQESILEENSLLQSKRDSFVVSPFGNTSLIKIYLRSISI